MTDHDLTPEHETLPSLELISFKLCPFVQRSVSILRYKKVPHRLRYVDLANPPAWFLALSPTRKVPLLRVGDTDVLFESAAINEFIDEITPGRLMPDDPLRRAKHRAWIAYGSRVLWLTRDLTDVQDADGFHATVKKLVDALAPLEHELGDGPYFAGNHLSLVDVAFAPLFMRVALFHAITDAVDLSALRKVSEWRDTLLALEAVAQSVVPDFPALMQDLIRRRQGYLSTLLPGGPAQGEKSDY